MPDRQDPQFDSLPEALPEALTDRLREIDGPRPFVPPDIDRAVMDQARTHFAERAEAMSPPRRLSPWVKFGLPVAAAAAIALGFLAIQTSRMLSDLKDGISQTPMALAPGGQAELAWDIDRSGNLDILDVYLLAKRREAGDENITPAILDSLCDRIVSLDRVTAFIDPPASPLQQAGHTPKALVYLTRNDSASSSSGGPKG